MIKKYTIYGERCSGTNYLENIININFDVQITWEYGWKHFFGFDDEKLLNSDDTLFICIVRNPIDWINSFYREMHHLKLRYEIDLSENEKLNKFLNDEIISIDDSSVEYEIKKEYNELLIDRNIYTKKRYKNIFELRHTKLKWMIEDLPNKVKNYIFIRYEDLINNFESTLFKIKNKGLIVKKKNTISSELILNNKNFISFYENKIYKIL
jgi:hypothetical protein